MASSDKLAKPSYQTLEIKLDNESKPVRIKRVPQSDLKQLIALQDELLGLYIKADGALAELLVDESVIELIKQYIGLLPIEGQKVEGEQKYLSYDDISENWEQLTRLVFNGSLDEKTRNIEGVTPSLVSNLHFLPYETQRELHLHKRRVEKTEELLKQREELEKLEKPQTEA